MARSRYIFATEKPKHKGRRFLLGVLITLVLLVLITVLYNYVTNRSVRYDSLKITVRSLPEDLESFTILHISDLQGRELGHEQSAILRAVGSPRVSCVVFTGDMIGEKGDVRPFLELVRGLPQNTEKFLITGDEDPTFTDAQAHSSLSAYADWAEEVRAAGVTILDEPAKLTRGKRDLWLVPEYLYSLDLNGMESTYTHQLKALEGAETSEAGLTPDQAAQKRVIQYELDRIGRIREIKSSMTAKDIQIAVTHAPLTADYVTTMFSWQSKNEVFSLRSVSLILAGHYCGGGWRVPGKGAVYVEDLGWWPDDGLITGLGYVAGIPQYISPGLSSMGSASPLPGRLFNQPAVTLIRLTSRLQ